MDEPLRFYFDQHVPEAVVVGLRQRGVDVLTAREVDRCGLSDSDQLAFATAKERILVTFDTDFLELHRSGMAHAGIVWSPAMKHAIGPLIQLLMLVHGLLDRDIMRNHVEYL